jgi:hypothetical protein
VPERLPGCVQEGEKEEKQPFWSPGLAGTIEKGLMVGVASVITDGAADEALAETEGSAATGLKVDPWIWTSLLRNTRKSRQRL